MSLQSCANHASMLKPHKLRCPCHDLSSCQQPALRHDTSTTNKKNAQKQHRHTVLTEPKPAEMADSVEGSS